MNTSNVTTSTSWIPFKIPATPQIPQDSEDIYVLSCGAGADPNKNPSQFLTWTQGTLPQGAEFGDILYWNPSSGSNGEWVILNPPETATEEAPQFLSFNGSNLLWRQSAFPDGENLGDLLYWDPTVPPQGAWVILQAQDPSSGEKNFLYWDGNSWQFAETKTFDVCENGEVKIFKIPAIEV